MPPFLNLNLGLNPWPKPKYGVEDALEERTRKRLQRALAYVQPTSMTTYADRIMGEITLRYQIPQDIADGVILADRLPAELRGLAAEDQEAPPLQGKPPMTDRMFTKHARKG